MSTANLPITDPVSQKNHKTIAWTLLGGLLFLRIPFEMVFRLFTQADWVYTVYQVGTYFLTAWLIYYERKRLTDFHFDKLAIIIIILIKPLQTILLILMNAKDHPLAFPSIPSLSIWFIAIGLALLLWRDRNDLPKLTKASFGWLGLGVLTGLAVTLILVYPGSVTISKSNIPMFFNAKSGFPNIAIMIFYQLGYAAVSEEPLFRGFLWGFLRQSGWKNVWIWLFQATLFILAHYYYFKDAPFSFWVVVPVGALAMGAIAWRSKTITASMAAHAVINGLGYISWVFLAKLLL